MEKLDQSVRYEKRKEVSWFSSCQLATGPTGLLWFKGQSALICPQPPNKVSRVLMFLQYFMHVGNWVSCSFWTLGQRYWWYAMTQLGESLQKQINPTRVATFGAKLDIVGQ